jgi:TatD DNase family protein
MIDTHCHLTHPRLAGEVDLVLARAREAGLGACITIGTGVEDAREARVLARAQPDFVRCTAGIDPFTAHRAGPAFAEQLDELEDLLGQGGFCALGEVGLDYHYDLDPRPVQAARLEAQLDLAVRLDLPVVIHVREAHGDMGTVLRAHPRARGVIHSFTAGPAEAAAYLDLGWHLAFNGVLTFPRADGVREAARIAPADRLLIETDSSYLAPAPHRGSRCEPAHVAHTLRRLAQVREQPIDLVDELTTACAGRLFRLDAGAIRTSTAPG